MLRKIKNYNRGFTIVETLIVLAIAGLIILIVLLAVPALQRSSRNTNLKTDSSAIASAINEYEGNNGGSLPTVASQAANTASTYTIGAAGTTQSTAKIQKGDAIVVVTTYPGAATAQTVGTITIMEGVTCESASSSPRSTAVWYAIETAGGTSTFNANSCIDT